MKPYVLLLALVIAVAGCRSSTYESPEKDLAADSTFLKNLTIQIQEDMLARNEMSLFSEYASSEYVVMIPNGKFETKEQSIGGAGNFHLDSVEISEVQINFGAVSAVVTGKWSLSGKLINYDMSGDYNFVSVYEWDSESWKLISDTVVKKKGLELALSE